MDSNPVQVIAGKLRLEGQLAIPLDPAGIVIFAHGSGSSRHSPRNQAVAQVLHDAHMATLLFDLLTSDEEIEDERTLKLRFDIALLADRLAGASDWLKQHRAFSNLRLGYFGASTGGAAALVAAARRPDGIGAVVSRGGRPDLAGDSLPQVLAPTLLIVGARDPVVIQLNQRAMLQLGCEKKLEIIPGATHLFEEPGALDRVTRLARDWFIQHLTPANHRR